MKKPKLLHSKFLAKSWLVNFCEDTLRYGSSNPFTLARIELPDFVLVVGEKENGKLALVRQYRNGARASFGIPAGFVEPKEKPIKTASREFDEELGYELNNPRLVKRVFTSPGRLSQRAHIYYGKVGEKSKNQFFDEAERLQTGFFSKKKALKSALQQPLFN